MSSFFGGNPFATPAGQRIEQATDAALASENWALNMEICDIINDTEDGPKDAIKAIRKRLQQYVAKNYTVVMYTLTVLETCVKNCGRRFHILATNKEFVQDLVKLIGPKNDPPTAVQEKVLSLIQSWADAFKQQPEMSGVVQVYTDLKSKGVEFPMTDLDAMAPIHTPQRSIRDLEAKPRAPPAAVPVPPQQVVVTPEGPVFLNGDQLAKLRSELDVVQGNLRVFNEMLGELTPGCEQASDRELLVDIHKTLQAMQKRIVELVNKVANEEVTSELLRVNDELNSAFLRYQRYEKSKPQSATAVAQNCVQNDPTPVSDAPLIDLSDGSASVDAVQVQLFNMNVKSAAPAPSYSVSSTLKQVPVVTAQQGSSNNANAEDEFDMFAQSRKATYETTKASGSTYSDNINVDQISGSLGAAAQSRSKPASDGGPEAEEFFDEKLQKEQDFAEMEAWLREQQAEANKPAQGVTSSEFDRFLAERAAAAETVPSLRSPSHSINGQQRRQIEKEETENRLFAL